MKKLAIWHIGVWLIVLSFFLIPVYFAGLSARLIYVIISFLIYISAFYINIVFILPWYMRKRKIIHLAGKLVFDDYLLYSSVHRITPVIPFI